MNRAEAIAKGEQQYHSDKPCPQGHLSNRFVSNYGCVKCQLEYGRSDKGKENFANAGLVRRMTGLQKQALLKYRYGITPKQKDEMLTAQNNKCKICEDEMVTPHIDHCHTTNKVRGLLCSKCNLGLGAFKDSTVNLQKAIEYLTK